MCIGWMRVPEEQKEVLHVFPTDETAAGASSQTQCPSIIRGRDHLIRGGCIKNEGRVIIGYKMNVSECGFKI